MNAASRELVFVLFMIGVLLIFGLVAVIIFFKVWRRERGSGASGGDPPARGPAK